MDTRGERLPLLINQDKIDQTEIKPPENEKKKSELIVILLMVIVVAFGSLNTVARKVISDLFQKGCFRKDLKIEVLN